MTAPRGHGPANADTPGPVRSDLDELFDRAPCGYLCCSPDGTVERVNSTFLELTGLRREDVVGRRRFVDLLTAGGRIYHETHYAPMLQMQGFAREIALDLVCADGSRLPVLVNSSLVRNAGGEPTSVRTVVFEATHRREYERELLRAKQGAEAAEARATALSRTLQQTLIPPSAPVIPGLDLAGAYHPAGDGLEVGGDFYDIFPVGNGEWVVAVGDVCGKGVEAAVVTALARYTLHAAAVEHEAPSEALRVLNEVLLGDATDRFCTVALVRLRRTDGGWRAVVASGGHPSPALRRADGTVASTGATGTLLGVLPVTRALDVVVELGPGDVLLLFTDGITEARRADDQFGEDGVARSLAPADGPAAEVVATVLEAATEHQDGPARDDIAVVAVRVV